jgi:hypothetical protein
MADVVSTFAAKDVGFASTVNQMQKTLAKFQSNLGGFALKVAGVAVAFVGIREAVQAFGAAIDMGGKLNDLSARTGESAGNLLVLQRAFENAGAGADAVGTTINRLQRAIVNAGEGSQAQVDAFNRLGLSFETLKTMTPTEQLQVVAKALKNVENDSDRTALAMELLGRGGGELLPLFRAMGVEIEVARKQLGSMPTVMDKTVAAFDTIGDNFNAIAGKATEFAAGLLQDLAPALADVTTRMANIDAAGLGQKLSQYAKDTVAWVTETFKLGDALKQVEVAVKGIGSGNFGGGLKLMFLTARDTALNAINTIVAAASAAVETIFKAVSQMFRSDGPLIHLLKTSFSIGANYFKEAIMSAMAAVLENFGPYGKKIADTMRYEAETAANSIKMLTKGIGAQIDLVGEDAKAIFASIPSKFGEAYKANMENPLFEMKERAKETAKEMESVAAATRAAAFDAEAFGKALSDAKIDKLAAIAESGMMSQNPEDKKFPWQGAGPSGGPSAPATGGGGGGAGSGGGGGGKSSDRPATFNERVAEMRGNRRARRDEEKAAAFEEQQRFSSAVRAQDRAQRKRDQAMTKARMKDMIAKDYGTQDFGRAYEEYKDAAPVGKALSREQFKEMYESMAKSPEQRAREEEEARQKAGGKGAEPEKSPMEVALDAIKQLVSSHLPSIDEKLPQHAIV